MISLNQLLDKVSTSTGMVPDEFGFAEKMLDALLDEPEVLSYTLFVRDPITGDLRLEKHNGIKHTEAIDGFILSRAEENRLRQNGTASSFRPRQYFADPHHAKLIVPLTSSRPISSVVVRHLIDAKGLEVYRDFVEREGIVSCVRYEHQDSKLSCADAILFVNFNCRFDFEADVRASELFDYIFEDIVADIDQIVHQLDNEYSSSLRQIVTILQPIRTLIASDADRSAEVFFTSLLQAVMVAMRVGPDQGFGTIHLFNPNTPKGDLTLCACNDDWAQDLHPVLHAFEGEGLVSWVALNRKSVLIGEMATSEFRHVRKQHARFPNVQSELAVPMLVGEDLVGVLNIECQRANAFQRQDVHTLWYAAAAAALAYELFRNMKRASSFEANVSDLLAIARKAADMGTRDDSVFNELASLVKNLISPRPDFAEIWMYDYLSETFSHQGASYAAFQREVAPREGGLSLFVLRHALPVWISRIGPTGSYTIEFWAPDAASGAEAWTMHPPQPASVLAELPKQVNHVVVQERIKCELGIPIVAHGRTVGVIWLKYDHADVGRPSPDDVSMITTLAGEIAIVADAIIQSEQREEKHIKEQITNRYLSAGMQRAHGMIGFLLYKPSEGKLGGDFCVSLSQGENSWAYLIGDVEGHGYEAALRMLPLITGFKIFHRESTSPNYVLQRLTSVNENESTGYATALCCSYFEMEDVAGPGSDAIIRRFVTTASAGHPSMILVRSKGAKTEDCPELSGPARTLALGTGLQCNFAEEYVEVFPGDIIIGYTDGVEEAKNVVGEQFGRHQIISVAVREHKSEPQRIAERILAEVSSFAGGNFTDDVTIIVLKMVDDRVNATVKT